jgi:hypothetical protein
MRFAKTYKPNGDFGFFTLLFVTTTEARIEHIRRETNRIPAFAVYYRFTTFPATQGDFCSAIWQSRNPEDTTRYTLVRE